MNLWKLITSFLKRVFKSRRTESETILGPTPFFDPKDRSPIYNVHADFIHYLVRTRLSLAETAALALTCKSLWWTLDGGQILFKLRERTKDRLEFLQLIQVRFPKHTVCHHCMNFRRRPFFRSICFFGNKECDFRNGALLVCSLGLHLPFTRAQELINYDLYGEKYGYPTAEIEYDTICGPTFNLFHFNVRAKVFCGELLIKLDFARQFSHGTAEHNRRNASFLSLETFHWVPWLTLCGICEEGEATSRFFKCESCSTELRYILDPERGGSFGELRVTQWFNLGPCNDPFNFKWYRFAHGHRLECPWKPVRQRELSYMGYLDDASPVELWKKRWF